MKRRDREAEPEQVAGILERFVGARGWDAGLHLAKLRERWAELAGAAVADRSAPERLAERVLTVACVDGTVASEVTLLGPLLTQRVNAALGGDVIDRVVGATARTRSRGRKQGA